MPTKTQAKAAVDNAAAAIKNDIDNTLPVGVDITDGNISFAPNHYFIRMNATTQAIADSWVATIKTNLQNQSRTFTARDFRGRREGESPGFTKYIEIVTTIATYIIIGYTN